MILQYLAVILLLFVGAILQSTLLGFLSETFYLDLIFVMVVLIGLYKDPVHGAMMATAAGYLQDLLVSDLTGFYMTGRLIIFFMVQVTRFRLNPNTPLSQFTIGALIGVIDRLIIILLHQVFMDPLSFSPKDLGLMLIGTLINAVLVPLFYLPFRFIPGFMKIRGGPRLPY